MVFHDVDDGVSILRLECHQKRLMAFNIVVAEFFMLLQALRAVIYQIAQKVVEEAAHEHQKRIVACFTQYVVELGFR